MLKPSGVALSLALLGSTMAQAQSWDQRPTNETITLVLDQGKTVVIEPSVITPVTAVKWWASITWYFRLRGTTSDTATQSPTSIALGTINPKKRNLPIYIVKLKTEDGSRKWSMKATTDEFFPIKDSEVFPGSSKPEPKRSEDGKWSITLPSKLDPGEYAVISDGDAWDFTVSQKSI